ncbi:DUF6882 domain-containing protein [Corallincola platygyrae]|uniref:DUF6882 domain-containing protein n=1 Tax=Corallincola platygyrae TaxID=1193278 RepID=A0ABW4XLH8_9GAMM
MSDEQNKMECSTHGKNSTTFICHHLSEGENLGFHMGFDPDDPDALYPDAWCDKCDEVLEKEGEWNDVSEAFANIKMVCSGCYQEIRERNWSQDNEALTDLIVSSFEYLQEVQESFMKTYGIGNYERWDWYQETGKLVFSQDGEPVVECDVDFVGTVSTRSDTWMWAWANDSLTDVIKTRSKSVRELGEESNYLKLACALWPADEVDGWEMAGIMAKLTNAIGAYRTPGENGFSYMVVSKARWVKPKKER